MARGHRLNSFVVLAAPVRASSLFRVGGDHVGLNVLGCRADISGTNCNRRVGARGLALTLSFPSLISHLAFCGRKAKCLLTYSVCPTGCGTGCERCTSFNNCQRCFTGFTLNPHTLPGEQRVVTCTHSQGHTLT